MQTGKNTMASAKEAAGNVAASAKSGMDKTKAIVQGQVEKMTVHTPTEKHVTEQRKNERKEEAEMNKLDAQDRHATERERAQTGSTFGHSGGHTVTGTPLVHTGQHHHSTYGIHEHGTSGDMTSGDVGRDPALSRTDRHHYT